jgi:ABC-type polysaccharide/polyol phosphate transport system ATPase subunit
MSLPTASKPMTEQPETSLTNQTIIHLEDVSVEYRAPQERIGTFKEYVIRLLEGKIKQQRFKALNGVNLEVNRGEVFGLIGPNGAGKSTLLKLVARVLRPTRGRVLVMGHVAPLLEVGAGFHPELTGRENIYLNGAMLGFSRQEMHEKFPRIVEFSELGDFIDAPLRTYSSGMSARLGFAVATDTQPDILIVDEILSVGDVAFQHKSFERIQAIKAQGATILLVSHTMSTIETMCQRAAWLHHGQIVSMGTAKEVVDRYLGRIYDEETAQLIEESNRGYLPTAGNDHIQIKQVKILNSQDNEQHIFYTGEPMKVQIEYTAYQPISSLEVGIAIHRQDGVHITGPNTAFDDLDIKAEPGTGGVVYSIPSISLLDGLYTITVALVNRDGNFIMDYHDRYYSFRVDNRGHRVKERYGLVTLSGEWLLL